MSSGPVLARLTFAPGTTFTGGVGITFVANSNMGATTWSVAAQGTTTIDLSADDGGDAINGPWSVTTLTNVSPHVVPQSGTIPS